jgi:uncharacterized SAM-binding protein YcdF (DUF218 family)
MFARMREAKLLLLPPLVCLLPGLTGLLLQRRRPRLGRGLVAGALLSLWFLCTPLVGTRLLDLLQGAPALTVDAELPPGAAIVVLSAGSAARAPEYGGPTVDARTLVRLRYGCRLARRSGRPLLVTGGPSWAGMPPLAVLMAEAARQDFGVAPRFVETTAFNTFSNATRSADLLRRAGIERVVLVTDAFHMPRARRAFAACGLEVLPAPSGFERPPEFSMVALLPSHKGLTSSALCCHEVLGLLWQTWVQEPSLPRPA